VADLSTVIAGNIRAQRARLNLRQADVGEALHLGQSAMSAIELGHRDVTMPELLIICRFMNIPLTTLLRDADPDDMRALGL
jgi:transcriptional regulator with XRE-family HTH domain